MTKLCFKVTSAFAAETKREEIVFREGLGNIRKLSKILAVEFLIRDLQKILDLYDLVVFL